MNQIDKCKFNVLNKVKSATTLSKSNTLEQMRARQNSSSLNTKIVVNKEKGQISKRRQQENKARQIFGKTDIACPPHPPLIRTRALFLLPSFSFLPYYRRNRQKVYFKSKF